MIRILIVDDSPTETMILQAIIESDPGMQVIGCARNGKQGVEMVEKLKPDLVTMDVRMPLMDGLEATREIMQHHPTPIVIISSKLNSEVDLTFRALEAGALSVLEKPMGITTMGFNKIKNNILNIVRAMSEVHVIKKCRFTKAPRIVKLENAVTQYDIIALGASVGGPQVLKKILTDLPADFPVPIVLVQHMITGFISGFAHWLNDYCKLKVKVAESHEILRPGHVYFAPDNIHMEVYKSQDTLISRLGGQQMVDGFCPSITVLLNSVAKACGSNAIGVLLTGMGSDGAEGLLALKKAQAHTIIQDPESSVVFGMASVAKALGAVDRIVDLDDFSDYLLRCVRKK